MILDAGPPFYDIGRRPLSRVPVVSNTADTITVGRGPIDDAVVAGRIPSAASLSGKRFVIVRRHTSSHNGVSNADQNLWQSAGFT